MKLGLLPRITMLQFIGKIIFAVGFVVGAVKYRLGIFVEIPERYRR